MSTSSWKLAAALALSLFGANAQAATVGLFYDAPSNLGTIDAAIAYTSANAPTASFTSSLIDYPAGAAATITANTNLSDYLGTNASGLSGASTTKVRSSVFVFSGYLDLSAGSQLFTVASAEGFRLIVGGSTVSQFAGTRGYAATSVTANPGSGVVAFTLYHFIQNGQAGLDFRIDGTAVAGVAAPGPGPGPAPVPLPASLTLMGAGLALLAGLRRGR